MSYVPPHLRNKQGGGSQSSPPSSNERPPSSFGRSGSYSRLPPDSSPSVSRSSSYDTFDRAGDRGPRGGGRGSSNLGPAEAIFPDWKPSERVQALNEEQINDIRQRLNVAVEVEEGQPSATPAVESFVDMVSSAAWASPPRAPSLLTPSCAVLEPFCWESSFRARSCATFRGAEARLLIAVAACRLVQHGPGQPDACPCFLPF